MTRLPPITGQPPDAMQRMLESHGVPVVWWPRSLGRREEIEAQRKWEADSQDLTRALCYFAARRLHHLCGISS